ncbi:MAG: CPBP family intramembrane metalloprotease [Gemmatimonadota bacterium]
MVRFVLLAFGITWVAVSPLVLSAWGVLPPLPGWLHGLGALGPVLAAWLSERDRGVFEAAGPSALSPGWVGVCLTTPLLFAGIALAVVAVRGQAIAGPLDRSFADPAWVVSLAVGSVLYGIGEEPGWRGWLQPRLQSRFSPLKATLILTAIWALWHAPFFAYRFDFEGVGTVLGFFTGLLAGAFWLAFLFNSTASVKVVAAWHVLWNVANLSLAPVSGLAVAILNALMMVLGFGVAVVFSRRGLRYGGSVPV